MNVPLRIQDSSFLDVKHASKKKKRSFSLETKAKKRQKEKKILL